MIEQLDLHKVKSELDAQHKRILERIENTRGKDQGGDVMNPGRDDLAYDYMSAEMQVAELARLEERLAQVDAALVRIEEGRYGVCDRCGNKISVARLRALPYASMCIQCQERAS